MVGELRCDRVSRRGRGYESMAFLCVQERRRGNRPWCKRSASPFAGVTLHRDGHARAARGVARSAVCCRLGACLLLLATGHKR